MDTKIFVFIMDICFSSKHDKEYTLEELNVLAEQGIIEKYSLEIFISRINRGISDSLYNSEVLLRYESPVDIICIACGSKNIICRTGVNPNMQSTADALVHSPGGSFNSGYCDKCNRDVPLTDVLKTKKDITEKYKQYKESDNGEPVSALCFITYCDDLYAQSVNIKLSLDVKKEDDDDYFYYCRDIEELKNLCTKTAEDFVLTRIDSFY